MGERNRPEKSRQIRTILESANIRLSAIRRAEERRKKLVLLPWANRTLRVYGHKWLFIQFCWAMPSYYSFAPDFASWRVLLGRSSSGFLRRRSFRHRIKFLDFSEREGIEDLKTLSQIQLDQRGRLTQL